MPPIKTVGIKDLKNNLSAYLQDVRRGTRILISDRSNVVAEIREPGASYSADSVDPILAEWMGAGLIVPPTRKKTDLEASPVSAVDGSAERLLEEDRAEGRT